VIEGCPGFAVHQMGVDGFGYKIQGPAGVFTAKMSAIFTALRHIAEVIRSRKIAHQTHPLVYECKQLCQNGIEAKLMWILSHLGLVGN
jgi:hypothetical protein